MTAKRDTRSLDGGLLSVSMPLLTVLSLLRGHVSAYPTGAPSSACAYMLPQHQDAVSMLLSSPYSVVTGSAAYSPGGSVRVTINGTVPFKGFLIQAQAVTSVSSSGSGATSLGPVVGSFMVEPGTKSVCGDEASGSGGLTHTSADYKTSVTLTWIAPAAGSGRMGNVQFIATIVQEYKIFWAQERSAIVMDSRSPSPGYSVVTPLAPVYMQDVSTADCGKTKSCIYDPPNCVNHGCSYILAWRKLLSSTPSSAVLIEFELQATGSDYVAVGFAAGRSMINNSMVVCVKTNDGAMVRQMHSTAEATPNPLRGSSNLLRRSAYADSGYIRCSFVWKNDPAVRSRGEAFDLSMPHYVTLAKGKSLLNNQGDIYKHNDKPRVSPMKLTMTSDSMIANAGAYTSTNWLVKVHGAVMVIAWVLCGGLGMFLARYYKRMWANRTHCAEKVWFTWHRILMLMCMILSVAGTIVIFVFVGGWTKLHASRDLPQAAHPILGIIAACLAVVNPILAAFRCNPASKKRPIFNWFHWFFGTAAHVFAVVCVFLGLMFPQAQVPGWLLWLFMGFCLFQFLWELILEIHQCCLYDKNKDKEEDYAVKHKGDAKASEPPYSGRGFKCAMLIIYAIVVIVVTAVMAIVILTHSP